MPAALATAPASSSDSAAVASEAPTSPKTASFAATLVPEKEVSEWSRTEFSWKDAMSKGIDSWSLVSQSFLAYMWPLIKLGWRANTVERENLPGLSSYHLNRVVGANFTREWDLQLNQKHPSLAKTLFYSARATILFGALCSSLQGLSSAVGRPLILRYLVLGVESDMSTETAVALVVTFGVVAFIEGYLGVLGRMVLGEYVGTVYMQGVSKLVVNKMSTSAAGLVDDDVPASFNVLKAANGDNKKGVVVDDDAGNDDDVASGETPREPKIKLPESTPQTAETSLLGNDLVRSVENIRAASALPMAVVGFVGGVVVLAVTVGWSCVTGLGIMIAILLLNVYISRITYFLEKRNVKTADERLQILSSVLDSVRAVKLFGWETKFLGRIKAVREREMYGVRLYRMAVVTNIVMGRISPVVSAAITLIVYSYAEDVPLDIATSFVTVSVFQALRLGLIMLPLASTSISTWSASMKRVEAYLLRPSRPPMQLLPDNDDDDDDDNNDANGGCVLEMSHVTLRWPQSRETALVDASVTVQRGQVVGVVGAVGAGKTTLLRGALQLMTARTGVCKITPRIAYVPQRALIIGGTIRDNILFGRPFDQAAFDNAVARSQLLRDIDRLPAREWSEVGERGTTLSGGQMQRLSVCRALYGRPTLIVMDDPLSAVDTKVCQRMWDEAIMGGGAAVLIALNQLAYLPQCDAIYYLAKGRIVESGSFARLMQSTRPNGFPTFVQQFASDPGDKPASSAQQQEDDEAAAAMAVKKRKSSMMNARSILMAEVRTTGAVSAGVYLAYVKAFGTAFALFCLTLVLVAYSISTFVDFVLSAWASSQPEPYSAASNAYAGVYGGLSVVYAMVLMTASMCISIGGVVASKRLHNDMIAHVLWAPMSWFESNSVGRIMSRFAGDLSRVDLFLGLSIDNALQISVQLLATSAVICIVVPPLAVMVFAAICAYSFLLIAVDRTMRQTKRISNAAMSPLLANVSELSQGREMARAFGQKDSGYVDALFKTRHAMSADEYARGNFFSGTLINFTYLYANFIAFVISITTAAVLVSLRGSYNPSYLGIALTYALLLPYLSSQAAQSMTTANMTFTSLERILEYDNIPQEPPHQLPSDPAATAWPSAGEIVFDHVTAQYRPGLPMCLKDCSFTVRGGESVGVVGRTGAGKSSLISVLFRLIDPVDGMVRIDGVDTKSVGLEALRSRISIIPQEPVLMLGTVRFNLDPFSEHTDADLCEALERVGMDARLSIDDQVEVAGGNLSAGERQLLCFARALILKQNRILVMDEPSSSLDMSTDRTMVQLIKSEFMRARKCTVLTVAHRIETIIGADRIMVMKDGAVAEFDAPRHLLRREGSEFGSMVSALGSQASSRLLLEADAQATPPMAAAKPGGPDDVPFV